MTTSIAAGMSHQVVQVQQQHEQLQQQLKVAEQEMGDAKHVRALSEEQLLQSEQALER